MEIYRLTDEVPEEVRKSNGECKKSNVSELIITDMKAGVKNPERVNVYVNSKFAFSLDVAQAVDFRLKVGMVLRPERLRELKKASEFGREYQRALEWVLMRPRSEREVRDYLRKREMMKDAKKRKAGWERDKEIAEVIARGEDATKLQKKTERIKKVEETKYDFKDLILERLVERGYVDDKKFAEFWVENRNVRKGVSQKKLKLELMKKGISSEIIDEAVSGRDEKEEIRKMIEKKRNKYSEPEKLMAYLCRQGFSYDLVREMVSEVL